MANIYVAHTANPARDRNLKEWDLPVARLNEAQKAICGVAITLDRDLLQRKTSGEIVPVPQYDITHEFKLWVPANNIQTLWNYFHEYRRTVNAWIPPG